MTLGKGLRGATLTIASFGLITTGLAVAGPTYADGDGSTVVVPESNQAPIIPIPLPVRPATIIPIEPVTLSGPSTAGINTSVTYTVGGTDGGNWTLTGPSIQIMSYNCGLATATCTPSFTFTTPATLGPLALTASNGTSSATTALTVTGPVSTTTVVTASNDGKVGQPTLITSTVTSSGGSSYVPTGQIVISDSNNAVIHSGALTQGPGAGQSNMYFRYTPTAPGTYTFIATYTGDAQATRSVSAQDALIASASGNPISLAVPPSLSENTPIVLTASLVPSSTRGTVGFTVNGAAISAAVPIINGTASFNWTPNIQGKVTLGAEYTTNNGGSGSTTDVVTIGAPTATDVITLIQPGWGAWGNGTAHAMGNGSNFPFTATTLSGAGVTLSETGPCTVSGLTLKVNAGSGVCNMTASTPGGNGYQGVSYSYTINLVPGTQSATLKAPVSGRYKVKKVLVLESATEQDTSAGQNISWKLKKKGRSNCKMMNRDSGAVTLKILKKGTCTVVGRAPGVAGAWEPFKTARKYTGR